MRLLILGLPAPPEIDESRCTAGFWGVANGAFERVEQSMVKDALQRVNRGALNLVD